MAGGVAPALWPDGSEQSRLCAGLLARSTWRHAQGAEHPVGRNDRYAALLRDPTNATYQSETEALQELYKSLQTGLEFTSDTRIGRPLGTFDRPRATRAEMRRSGRSLNNVVVSLTSLQQLARALASEDADLTSQIDAAFDKALARADEIAQIDGGADFSLVDEPQNRLKLEVLQQNIDSIRDLLAMKLGPQLGVSAGFNSLDGD